MVTKQINIAKIIKCFVKVLTPLNRYPYVYGMGELPWGILDHAMAVNNDGHKVWWLI